ncbi:hypothetical protein [Phreatobacter sp. AB_2022a]|uniref:hypothetical protein n=1 Tax=Phreatobacter sp. AB_2022a TaxID=3003134 RepID=UPI002287061B|nr:hypothetical protein [Phreatobacter sp. AB_2022a]MCZ0733747.1 hypothetical protein [Phreatobacter sp. AB_2022a]
MRALIPARAAGLALAGLIFAATPLAAQEACAPAILESHTAEAMVADAEMRAQAAAALEACANLAREQQRQSGEIEERVLVQIAALAGRGTLASYAADEIPQSPAILISLLEGAFDKLYPHLRALPEQENAAVMRALFFQLADQAGSRTTGSTR